MEVAYEVKKKKKKKKKRKKRRSQEIQEDFSAEGVEQQEGVERKEPVDPLGVAFPGIAFGEKNAIEGEGDPEAEADESQAPVVEPEGAVAEPEGSVAEPEGAVAELEGAVAEPEAPILEPQPADERDAPQVQRLENDGQLDNAPGVVQIDNEPGIAQVVSVFPQLEKPEPGGPHQPDFESVFPKFSQSSQLQNDAEEHKEEKLDEEPEVQSKIQSEVQLEVRPEVRPEIRPEVQPEVQHKVQPEDQPVVQLEVQAEVQAEVQPGVQAEVQSEVVSESADVFRELEQQEDVKVEDAEVERGELNIREVSLSEFKEHVKLEEPKFEISAVENQVEQELEHDDLPPLEKDDLPILEKVDKKELSSVSEEAENKFSALDFLQQPLPSAKELIQEQEEEIDVPLKRISISDQFKQVSPASQLESDIILQRLFAEYQKDYEDVTSWFEKRAKVIDGEFYRMVDAYRNAQFEAELQKQIVDDHTVACDSLLDSLWKLERREATQTVICADGEKVHQTHVFKVAVFDRKKAKKLQGKLAKSRHHRITELTSKKFLAMTNLLKVEVFLNDFLLSHGYLAHNPTDFAVYPSDMVSAIRYFIDVLFHFENSYHSSMQFQKSVRKWLIILVEILYHIGDRSDQRYVFQHVIRCRGVTTWSNFVQFSDSDHFGQESKAHFIRMLWMLLNPIERAAGRDKNVSKQHLEVKTSRRGSASSVDSWIVLDSEETKRPEDDPDDFATRLRLYESDFLKIMDFFPLKRFIQSLFEQALSPYQNRSKTLPQAFGYTKLVLDLLKNGLKNLTEYPNFSKQIARVITSLSDIILEIVLVRISSLYSQESLPPGMFSPSIFAPETRGPMYGSGEAEFSDEKLDHPEVTPRGPGEIPVFAREPGSVDEVLAATAGVARTGAYDEVDQTMIQTELDWLCIRSVAFLNSHASKQPAVRSFLSSFDFNHISQGGAGQVFLVIFCNKNYEDYADSSVEFETLTLSHWLELMKADGLSRPRFAELMSDTQGSLHLLMSLTNLAKQQAGDLPKIYAYEIFQVAYLNVQTRETLFRQCQDLFSSVCDDHPYTISTILHLVVKNFKWLQKASIHLFKCLNLKKWTLDERSDIKSLKSLLRSSFSSSENELGRYILKHLNYDVQRRLPNLPVLSSRLHRLLLVMLGEVRIHHLKEYAQSGFVFGHRFSAAPTEWWLKSVAAIPTHDSNGILLEEPTEVSLMQRALLKAGIPENIQHVVDMSDPVLTYVDLNTCNLAVDPNYLGGDGWSVIENVFIKHDGAYASLGFKLVYNLFPYHARTGESLAAFQEALNYPILPRMLDIDRRKGILSVFHSKFSTSERVRLSVDLLVSHIANAIMTKYLPRHDPPILEDNQMGFSSQITSFWLSEIVNAAHEHHGHQWPKDHNCRHLLDQIVACTYILQPVVEGGPDGLVTINQFLQQQTMLFAPPKKSSDNKKELLDFSPSYDVLSCIKPHEASRHYPWLTFQNIRQSAQMDREAWLNLGAIVLEYPQSMPIKEILKKKRFNKEVLWECIVRRWASYAVFLDLEHPLQPLYWQMFFTHYFEKIPNIVYGKGNESGCFGYRFLEGKSGGTLSTGCRNKLKQLSQHFFSLFNNTRKDLHRKLAHIYHAMEMWLTKPFNKLLSDFQNGRATDEYCPERLTTLLFADPADQRRTYFWWDLVDVKELRRRLNDRCKHLFPIIRTIDKPVEPIKEEKIDKQPDEYETPMGPPGLRRSRKLRSTSACEKEIPPVVNVYGLILDIPQCLRIPIFNAMSGNASKECVFTIQASSKDYSERLSQHLGMDVQIIDNVPRIYRNVEHDTRIEKGCNRFTSCTGKAVFIFRHQEATKIKAVTDTINQARIRISSYADTTDITLQFCAELLRISRVIRHLISAQKSAEIHRIGQDWLFDLIELDSSELREYPPARNFMQRAIKSLGQMFIQSNLANQIKLLRTLSHHPHLIDALVVAVNPPFSHFVELLRVAVQIVDPQKRAVPQILERFDMENWLRLNPSLSDRTEVFRICAASLRDEMAKSKNVHNDDNPICHLISKMISRVAVFNFPELFREYVSLNLAGSRSREILPEMWSQMSKFPLNSLPWDYVQDTLANISNTLWNHRYSLIAQKSRHSLYTIWGLYIPDMFIFVKKLFEVSATHVIRNPEIIHRIWNGVWQVFGPWLASSVQKEQNNQDLQPKMMPSFPWHREDAALAGLVLESFVIVVHTIATYDQRNTLSHVWNLYSNNLIPHADFNVISLTQNSMAIINWELLPWKIDNSVLESMARVLKEASLSSKKAQIAGFLSQILSKVDWKAGLLIPQEQSSYTIQFLSLVVSILAELNIPLDDHTTHLLYSFRSDTWSDLSLEDYQTLLENVSDVLYGSRWEHLRDLSAKEESKFSALPISGSASPKDIVTSEDRAAYVLQLMVVLATGTCHALQPDVELSEQEEKEVPISLNLEKLRLCSEWLLSTFQEKGPIPLAHPKRYAEIAVNLIDKVHTLAEKTDGPRKLFIEILQEFISLVNLPDQGSPVPREIHGVIDFIFDKRPHLAMYALTGSCRTLLSPNTLSMATERCIDSMFTFQQKSDWFDVLDALEVPEIDEREFIDVCIQNGSVHTLHAIAKIKTTAVKHDNYNPTKAQALLEDIVNWLAMLDMQAGDHQKLIPFWWSALDWQINIIVDLQNPKNMSRKHWLSSSMLKLANSTMKTLYKHIAKHSLDKKTGGLLGAIGLGHKSRHSLEFRLAARAMSTFLICQSDGKYNFFWSGDNTSMKKSSTIQHIAKQLEEFRKIGESKHYNSLKSQIENIHAYLKSANVPLTDFRPVFRHICAVLFPGLPNLLPYPHHASFSE